MGADFTYSLLPACDLTPQRRRQLQDHIASAQPDPDEMLASFGETDLATARATCLALVEEYPGWRFRRDVALIQFPGTPKPNHLISGGMSWGDPPTEACPLFDQLGCFAYDLLAIWANDDARKLHP